jgi:hypothetical protein
VDGQAPHGAARAGDRDRTVTGPKAPGLEAFQRHRGREAGHADDGGLPRRQPLGHMLQVARGHAHDFGESAIEVDPGLETMHQHGIAGAEGRVVGGNDLAHRLDARYARIAGNDAGLAQQGQAVLVVHARIAGAQRDLAGRQLIGREGLQGRVRLSVLLAHDEGVEGGVHGWAP